MNEKMLDESTLRSLRDQNIIDSNEIAFIVGDKYVAQNIITNSRRVLENINLSNAQHNRRVLKG